MALTEHFQRIVKIQKEQKAINERFLQMEPGTSGYRTLVKRAKFLIDELHKTRKAESYVKNLIRKSRDTQRYYKNQRRKK